MSDPVHKAARSKAKDARQMPLPDGRVPRSKSKKKKPVSIEWRLKPEWVEQSRWHWWGKSWSRFGRYRSVAEATATMEQQERKYPMYEFRIVDGS